ncbi:MAG: class II glutamine amidotransferase [Polyangiaceae bacterium]|nr:class II glutamine amidotransferase [Polyangiaceae bacterium]
MCELFGFSGDRALDLSGWLGPFRLRGGATGDNPDGWGVAWWDDPRPVLIKSPEPGHASAAFAELSSRLRAQLVIAHVRRARHPPVPGMLNTHPFAHECCNREWVFAHNGLVPEVIDWQPTGPLCLPDGDTDSEHAFCQLLTAVAERYDESSSDGWIRGLAELAERIAALGKFNFLLSEGRLLVAYGHDRLHYLEHDDEAGKHVLVATEALTGDAWQPFAARELRVYRDGELLTSVPH